MTTTRTPQAGPAMVLAQLLTEHPELPHLEWGLYPDGLLRGALFGDTDVRGVLGAYQEVLGGTVHATRYEHAGAVRYREYLTVTWRDVQLTLCVSGPAAVLTETALGVAA